MKIFFSLFLFRRSFPFRVSICVQYFFDAVRNQTFKQKIPTTVVKRAYGGHQQNISRERALNIDR